MTIYHGDEYKINGMNQAHGISGRFDFNASNPTEQRLSNTFFPIRRNQSVGSVIDFNWLRLISVNASYFVDRHKPLQIFYILRAFHSAQPNSTQWNGSIDMGFVFLRAGHTLCGRFMNCAVCAPNGFNLCNAFSTRQKPSRP